MAQKAFYSILLLICLCLLGFLVFKNIRKSSISSLEYSTSNTNDIQEIRNNAANSNGLKHEIEEGSGYVGIIIDNLGMNREMLETSLRLPRSISLGFSPYAHDVSSLIDTARAEGFEVLLKIFMQTNMYPFDDFGPYTLLDQFDDAQNKARMQTILNMSDDISGIYTNQHETFTDDLENAEFVLKFFEAHIQSAKRNMALLYTDESDTKSMLRVATTIGAEKNLLLVDMWIHAENTKDEIAESLTSLETIARSRGIAVIVVQPTRLTLRALEDWMENTSNEKITFLPITTLLRQRAIMMHKMNEVGMIRH